MHMPFELVFASSRIGAVHFNGCVRARGLYLPKWWQSDGLDNVRKDRRGEVERKETRFGSVGVAGDSEAGGEPAMRLGWQAGASACELGGGAAAAADELAA
eukprot:2406599-Pleurochrysis_carterae.AAC.2